MPPSHSGFPRTQRCMLSTDLLLTRSPSPSLINPCPPPPSPPAAPHRVLCQDPYTSQQPVPIPPGPCSSTAPKQHKHGTALQPLSLSTFILLILEARTQHCWWHALWVPSPRLPQQQRVPCQSPCFHRGLGICLHRLVTLLQDPQGKGLEMWLLSVLLWEGLQDDRHHARRGDWASLVHLPSHRCSPWPHWSQCETGLEGALCSHWVPATGPPPGLRLGVGMLRLHHPTAPHESWAAAPATVWQDAALSQVGKKAAA